jgi:nitroimidazol reductase NimA-like FMN-containing flavoprotein (pyridoxamine 5'-phosphate oxidase superfamily)
VKVHLDARFSDPNATPTPWPEVEDIITAAELFWISTVRKDGRPHVTPVPTVWHDGALYFCTGPGEQKEVNLAANPQCALTTGNNAWKAGLDVVVEGSAVRVEDEKDLRVLADMWREKYHGDWDFDVADGAFHHDDGGTAYVFQVAPAKVLAFAKGAFAQTRYTW